jgi:hypothetical protein
LVRQEKTGALENILSAIERSINELGGDEDEGTDRHHRPAQVVASGEIAAQEPHA